MNPSHGYEEWKVVPDYKRFNVKKRTIQAVQWRQNWKHI